MKDKSLDTLYRAISYTQRPKHSDLDLGKDLPRLILAYGAFGTCISDLDPHWFCSPESGSSSSKMYKNIILCTFHNCIKPLKISNGNWSYSGLRIRIFPSRIQDHKIPDPGSGSASKNLSIFNPKMSLSSRKYDLGCSSQIPDPDLDFLPIPDPGSRGQKGTGFRTRIRNTGHIGFTVRWSI